MSPTSRLLIESTSQCSPMISQVSWLRWATDAVSWVLFRDVYLYKCKKLSALFPQSTCVVLSPNYLSTLSEGDTKAEGLTLKGIIQA